MSIGDGALRGDDCRVPVRVDASCDLEAPVMRGTRFAGDLVDYAGPLASEKLLQGRLEVEEGLGGQGDLVAECRHRGLGGCLEAMMEIAGADRRLANGGQSALAGDERLRVDPPLEVDRRHRTQHLGHPELLRHLHARPPAHRLPVDLGQPADVRAGKPAEEVLGDGQPEHAVAQEREAPVGVSAMFDPRGVSDHLAAQVRRQRVDQVGEPSRVPGPAPTASPAKPPNPPRHAASWPPRAAPRRSRPPGQPSRSAPPPPRRP